MAPKQKPEAKKQEATKKQDAKPKAKPQAKPEPKQKKEEKKPVKDEKKQPKPKAEAKKPAKPAAKPSAKPSKQEKEKTPKPAKPEAKKAKPEKESKTKKGGQSTKGKKPHGSGVFIKDLDFPGLSHQSVIETFKQFKSSITEVRVRHNRYVMVFLKTPEIVKKFLEFDGKTVRGCKIQVQPIKRAQPTRPREEYCRTIYVSGLPGKTTARHLKGHFGHIGKILKIRIYNKPKVHAFIYFRRTEHALKALKRAKKPYLHGRSYKHVHVPRAQTFRLTAKLSIRTIQLDRIKWVKRYYRAPPSEIRAREKKTLDRQKRRILRLRSAKKVPEAEIKRRYPNILGKRGGAVPPLPWWAMPNPKDRVHRKKAPESESKRKPKSKSKDSKKTKGQAGAPKPAKPQPKTSQPQKAAKPQPKDAKPKDAKPKPKDAKPKPKDAKPKDTKPKDAKPKDAKAQPKDAKPKPKDAKPKPKDAKPKDAKPKPKDSKPKDAKPKDAKPQAKEAKPKDAKPKPKDSKPKDAKPKPKEAKPKDAKPKPKEAKPKDAKPKPKESKPQPKPKK